MDFTAAARGIFDGIKNAAGPEMRETLETINAGLETVETGVRVVSGVLDTIERGVSLGRDLFGTWHRNGGAGSEQAASGRPAAATGAAASPGATAPSDAAAATGVPFKSAAERGDELLRQAREDAKFNQMLAIHQRMQEQTRMVLNSARDRQDTINRLRGVGSSSSSSSRSFSRF